MKIFGYLRNSKVLQVLILFLALLVVFELLAKGGLYLLLGLNESSYAHHYKNDPILPLLTWTVGFTPHPYFGYESPGLRESENILEKVDDDDFVIGILGGSVADSFGKYCRKHVNQFEPLRDVFPTIGKKNIRIVNLALGASKQPQQFFIAAYFMDKLDLVINLDGFNDSSAGHQLPIYPLEFPSLSPKFYKRASQGGVYAVIGRTARWTYKKLTYAPLEIPGLSQSSFYFMSWYYLRGPLHQVLRLAEVEYYTTTFIAHQSEALRKSSQKELIEKRIAIWKKYTILEDDLVRKRTGKPVIFFLQPNQYLKNSKPFSEQEKQVAFKSNGSEIIHERMTLLRSATEDLQRSGVPIVDLTGIFSDRTETIYIDACCHINSVGNQIMADAVASHLMRYQAESALSEQPH